MGNQKKKNTNKSDFLEGVIFWIPELLFFPIRVLLMAVKGIGKLIRNYFDFV
ncbi:MAG: hypothetical protein ACQEV0_09250 [Bacillota bacterium]